MGRAIPEDPRHVPLLPDFAAGALSVRLPRWLVALGFAGLVPFFAGPLALALGVSPQGVDLDAAWRVYVAVVAAFLAGTFWGFALVAVNGGAGAAGVLIASGLTLATAAAALLPLRESLFALALVYLLLLLADYWRERALDTIPGYFALRAVLTAGALLAITLRLLLP